MVLTENLDIFLDSTARGHGREVLIGPQGAETAINAVFDNEHFQFDDGGLVPVSGSQPVMLCKSADLTALGAGNGTRAVIDGIVYRIRVIRPVDDGAFSEVTLHK